MTTGKVFCQSCGQKLGSKPWPESAAFNVRESAKYLGIGHVAFWELRAKRFVPYVLLPGGGIRYRKVVLDNLLDEMEIKTRQEAIQCNDRRRKASAFVPK